MEKHTYKYMATGQLLMVHIRACKLHLVIEEVIASDPELIISTDAAALLNSIQSNNVMMKTALHLTLTQFWFLDSTGLMMDLLKNL